MRIKDVVRTTQPCDYTEGTVISADPLQIKIDDKRILTERNLYLTNAVKDHSVDITVSWQTVDDDYLHEGAMQHTHDGSPLVGNLGAPITGQTGTTMNFDTTHHHDIKGRKKITVHNGLTVGETVLLLRKQGGGRYIVIDRITSALTEGEWI